MNNKTILQVPVDVNLRDQALKTAKNLGFSSLQEVVRVFLKQLTDRKVTFLMK